MAVTEWKVRKSCLTPKPPTALPDGLSDEEQEVEKLRIIASRRAEAANAKWVEDVRKRKLCIANGSGTVHGITCDLEGQFGIGLRPVAGKT